MAYAQLAGQGMPYPTYPYFTLHPPALSTAMILDGGTDKVAFCGRVWYPSRTSTKDISKIHFRAGAITSDGSTFRVGLDTVSTTTGPPCQPEGTNDQSGTALVSALTANSWNSITLSANRTGVAFGSQLAVVFDYSAYTAASVVVSCYTSFQSGPYGDLGAVLSNAGGAYAAQIVVPNVVLEFTDATFGTLDGAFPFSNNGVNTFHLSTPTNDEFGLQFQVPFGCKVDGAWFVMAAGVSGEVEVLLYSTPGGTPAALTGTPITIDEDDQTVVAGSARPFFVPFSQEITLSANTDYALALRPLAGVNHNTYYFDVNDANHFTLHSGGTVCKEVYRADNTGAFTASNSSKRRPFMGVRISSIDTGSASSSSGVIGG